MSFFLLFLSRLLCQRMSSKSSRKSSEKKTKKRDRFIGRTCVINASSLARERETQKISSLFFFEMSLSFFLSFFLSVFLFQSRSNSPSATKSFSFVSTKRPKKIDPTQKKKKKKRNTTPAATSETHPIGLTVEKTKTTTTKRGDHRDETRERETSFVSARLPETTTSFCRERKRERRAKAQRDVFVAINQFERRKR